MEAIHINATNLEESKCVFNVQTHDFIQGKGSYKCGRDAVVTDVNGRTLCRRHYNQWKKKIDKRIAKRVNHG